MPKWEYLKIPIQTFCHILKHGCSSYQVNHIKKSHVSDGSIFFYLLLNFGYFLCIILVMDICYVIAESYHTVIQAQVHDYQVFIYTNKEQKQRSRYLLLSL